MAIPQFRVGEQGLYEKLVYRRRECAEGVVEMSNDGRKIGRTAKPRYEHSRKDWKEPKHDTQVRTLASKVTS